MEELPASQAVCPRCGYNNKTDPAKQPAHALPCGTKLHGKYVLGRILGQGGFGMTYIGWDEALNIRICVKEYFPEGVSLRNGQRDTCVYWNDNGNINIKSGLNAFIQEAHKTAKLRDLHSIVKVWDVFGENHTAYIIMDYIEGVTVKKYLLQVGKNWSEEECVRYLAPVMRDLAEVHKRKIIHRDISPDNLMRRPDGSLVLLDLGAALDLNQGTTRSEYAVAKKGFSPIEQYTQRTRIGPWTDVYAMCATIVYCVTGKSLPAPLERYNGHEIDLNGFSSNFAQVLTHGLVIEPDKRIQSMEALLAALEEALKKPEPRIAKRRPLMAGILTMSISVLLVLAVLGITRKAAAPESLLETSAETVFPSPTAKEPLQAEAEAEALSEEDAAAMYRRGRESEDAGNYSEAVRDYQIAAQAGNNDAQFRMGYLFFHGLGVEQNFTTAREYYEAAAEQGNSSAMLELGLLYYSGTGGEERDYEKALTYFQRAAELGSSDAMLNIGNMYYYGHGVSVDEQRASLWWNKAERTSGQTYILPVSR